MINAIRICENDNVIVVLEAAPRGSCILDPASGEFTTTTDVPRFHKIATQEIKKGGEVIKYGSPIGTATQDIPIGAHVHTHNLDSLDTMVEHVGGAG